ncbi:hypothetical protein L484_011192 [Morus notabilis]|uniref:Uncharacterized protein n=1 Tax=Morus notabilis TaxID=981085 RepID=W9SKU4_9ROSA|nr:hypothetical protein L484_011192 [Morus notabilis]
MREKHASSLQHKDGYEKDICGAGFSLLLQITMASISPTNEKKKKETSIPPKRGQIKAQIFESLVKTVVSMASGAGAHSATGETSASTAPPPSSYNSNYA